MTMEAKRGTMGDGGVVIYATQDGQATIDVKVVGETVWLSQAQMAELFGTDRTSILRHIKNIYKTGELEEAATCAFFAQVRSEGKRTVRRRMPYFNLDVIIAVGYRVNSIRGTQFRIWANRVLKEYLVRGYAIDSQLDARKYGGLSQLVQELGGVIGEKPQSAHSEADELTRVLEDYAYALDTLDTEGVMLLAKHMPNNKAAGFLDWFTYGDNSIDGRSRKKAYQLFGSGHARKRLGQSAYQGLGAASPHHEDRRPRDVHEGHRLFLLLRTGRVKPRTGGGALAASFAAGGEEKEL